MGEEDSKKVKVELLDTAPPAPESEEKAVTPPAMEEVVDDTKALAIVEKVEDTPTEKSTRTSTDRDAHLSRLETEKRMSLIKAWEESEKARAENKAIKKLSSITAWENSKKATTEAALKEKEEELERKKAEYAERMKNKLAMIHRAAEEKRAFVEAKRGEELLKAEETAAKYRARGISPKKILGCFAS